MSAFQHLERLTLIGMDTYYIKTLKIQVFFKVISTYQVYGIKRGYINCVN